MKRCAESPAPGRTRDWTILRFALEAIGQGKETYHQLSPPTKSIADPQVQGWARDWLHH